MDLDVVFIGTAGAAPSARRGLPSTLIRRGGDRLLFDCGEGTQRQLLKSVGLVDLEHVFLTHYHADHVLGIPGMLKSFALRDRDTPITIYGPWLRRMMCYVVPGAFVAYFPALALLGRPDPLGLPEALQWSSPLVAAIAVTGARLVWRTGVRHYQGTGS